MSASINLDPSKIGPSKAVFLQTYYDKGLTHSEFVIRVTLSKPAIYAAISEVFSSAGGITCDGTHSLHPGGLIVDTTDFGEFVEVAVEVVSDPKLSRRLMHDLSEFRWTKSQPPGVHDVDIHHMFLDNRGNNQTVSHNKVTTDFDKLVPDMYPRIKLEDMMKLYAESDESNIILTGEPGTGKTCFAKMMMASYARFLKHDIVVIYVKDRELLKKDAFWARLSDINPEMLILDDLDDELRPRTEGRNEIVNNLLSFSDGVFDSDTKIIITTNLTDNSIDKALIRPGRCFDILSLPQLTVDEAADVWTNKFESSRESFDSRFGTVGTKVSQAALMSEHFRYLKSAEPTYLLDQSISIRSIIS